MLIFISNRHANLEVQLGANYSTDLKKMIVNSYITKQQSAQELGRSRKVVCESAGFRLDLTSVFIPGFLFIWNLHR